MNVNNTILKRKSFKIIVVVAVSLLILLAAIFTYYKIFMDPYRETISQTEVTLDLDQTLTREQAMEDLQYVKEQMEKYHPAYLDGSYEKTDKVTQQYQKEVDALKDRITVLELWQMAGRIAAKLEDGHTNISVYNTENYFISDIRQLKDYGNPLAINGIATDDLYQVFRSQFSYELESYAEFMFYHVAITNKNYLSFSGVDTSDGVVFTFKSDQEKIDYHYKFVPLDQVIGLDDEEEDNPPVSYDIDPEHNLAVFTLKECDYNEEYLAKLQDFFNEVYKNHIDNIAVDLRNNPGGNSLVANSFLEYIDVDTYQSWDCAIRFGWYLLENTDNIYKNQKKEPSFQGKIFVLTNTRTYSSAMDFAMLIKDNNLGVIVGEASGNLPNSYGDILGFQLPNSKLYLNVSYKKWYRVDKTKAEEPLNPDYAVESEDALEEVYELLK